MASDESLRRKFDAAVQTIQRLPRNGTFQPSNEMKLRFYAYFKQATVGAVNIPRPAFYDPINRAKWDAWNRLGKMSSDEAMQGYVDEIINAAQLLPDSPEKDELLAIMDMPKASSQEVVEETPHRKAEQSGDSDSDEEFVDTVDSLDTGDESKDVRTEASLAQDDKSEHDGVVQVAPTVVNVPFSLVSSTPPIAFATTTSTPSSMHTTAVDTPLSTHQSGRVVQASTGSSTSQVRLSVSQASAGSASAFTDTKRDERLEERLTSIHNRLDNVEAGLGNLTKEAPWWWPFPGMERRALLTLLFWPFLVNFILRLIGRTRTSR